MAGSDVEDFEEAHRALGGGEETRLLQVVF